MSKESAPPVVFLADAVEVAGPRAEVERRLCTAGPRLLSLAAAATASGEAILLTIGRGFGEQLLGVLAAVRLGPYWTRHGTAAVAIHWEVAGLGGAAPVLPVLDGTLLVAALGEVRCLLAIEAAYRPPVDRVDAIFDRVLLHRIAESTVHDFVKRLGIELTASGVGLQRPSERLAVAAR